MYIASDCQEFERKGRLGLSNELGLGEPIGKERKEKKKETEHWQNSIYAVNDLPVSVKFKWLFEAVAVEVGLDFKLNA
jgi:hypothetical protein